MNRKPNKNHERLIVALLADTREAAREQVRLLKKYVKTFEVGLPVYTALGPDVISLIRDEGCNVCLDLKYHDIPSTVARAVKVATRLGVSMLTIHASGGTKMLQDAKRAALEIAGSEEKIPTILAVTVLTSMDTIADIGIQFEVRDQVVRLAKLAHQSGVHGVIASPLEIKPIRNACGDKFLIVTTGLRPFGTAAEDQRRIATPKDAIVAGADYLVIGRPILLSDDPSGNLQKILAEMA